MSEMLSQWEIESKDWPHRDIGMIFSKRILTLIDLIRKKDWALQELHNESINHSDNALSSKWIEEVTKEALALTASLLQNKIHNDDGEGAGEA